VGWVEKNITQPAGKALASVDPGPALGRAGESIDKAVTQPIGRGLAEVDKFVNRELPGGWLTPAAIATYFASPYIAAALTAETAAAATAAEAAAALEAAAIAEGATTAGMVGAANTGCSRRCISSRSWICIAIYRSI
jgi:hypothetical protein